MKCSLVSPSTNNVSIESVVANIDFAIGKPLVDGVRKVMIPLQSYLGIFEPR
jgi:hypothetical protein